MKFEKFLIENYRAIESTEITLKDNLIPLIGINESGKTSVLHAILCFDERRDADNNGSHLKYENRYDLEPKDAKIIAQVLIETEIEVTQIANKLGLEHGNEIISFLQMCRTNSTPILITRTLSKDEEKKYSVNLTLPNVSPETNESLARALHEHTPYILYFEDFSQSITETITFPLSYDYKKKDVTSLAESRNLLMEIFKQATDGKYTLEDFINLPTKDDKKDDILREVKNKLHQEIIKEWDELRKKGIAAADVETENLSLEIKYRPSEGDKKPHEFEFKVVDSTNNQAGRGFSLNKRSTGFNWFFNFIIKLKYNPEHPENNPDGAIYLLDEPGSNLHSSAQEGLLEELKKRSERNKIIFGTHSQYLLDPHIVNPKGVKIVEKKKGKTTIKIFSKANVRHDQGAFTPLFHALHLKVGTHTFNKQKIILTEGITDFYFLKMLINYHPLFPNKEVTIIPGHGATTLDSLISLAIGCAESYLVLLDSDLGGNDGYKRYSKHFGAEEAQRNICQYVIPSKTTNVVLEDFLSEASKEKIKSISGLQDVKASIISLYYLDISVQKDFIETLDANTLSNLKPLTERINNLLTSASAVEAKETVTKSPV